MMKLNLNFVAMAACVLCFTACVPTAKFNATQQALASARYDSAQLALAWDRVDDGYLRAPRRWVSGGLQAHWHP